MKNTIKNIIAKYTSKKSPWSIGLYEADITNPFDLKNTYTNPVLTNKDITDCDAAFVADPFLISENGKFFLFFEIKDKNSNKGVIGLASSDNGRDFKYEKTVLKEKYHLSYPGVYKIDNNWFMIPEIGQSNEVRIYKADIFPYKWSFYKTILSGRNFADPTLFFYNNYYYLFVSDEKHETLEIYYSEKFDAHYKPHAQNPIYKNKQIARPAGPILKFQNRLYRFSQDCKRRYGEKVNMFEITKLSPETYQEKFIKHILTPNPGKNWNAKKMHHICHLKLNDKYLIAVDAEGFK
jgi:hypothetical protein